MCIVIYSTYVNVGTPGSSRYGKCEHICSHHDRAGVVGLGMGSVVFWTSSVVFCAAFDHSHHHNYASDEYSAQDTRDRLITVIISGLPLHSALLPRVLEGAEFVKNGRNTTN